jgi:NAD(P)-dependent dehydrogenase (short-subunit alcohol dehydrogenase family)
MRFVNKVALITAGANGIGRATALIMVREGATVVVVDNNQGHLDEAVPACARRRAVRWKGRRQAGRRA